MDRTIVEAILAHGVQTPDKLAVGFKQTRITYAKLSQQIRRCAMLLRDLYGIKPKDKVMLTALPKPEYIVTFFGLQYLGAITVPIDKAAKEDSVLKLYDFVGPKVLISDNPIQDVRLIRASMKALYARVLEEGRVDTTSYVSPENDSVAEMIFTTGTTGFPKGVMLTCANIMAISRNNQLGVGMLPSDKVLIPLPFFHSVALRVMRTALYIGASIVLQNGFTFAKDIETNIEEFGCTALVAVPASLELVYRQMREHFVPIIGQLRYIEVGSGSLGYDMKKKLIKQLPKTKVYNTWGSSETGGAIFLDLSLNKNKLTSLGRPVDGVSIKVVGQDGSEIHACDINTAGRLALQGDMRMSGYYQLPEINKKTIIDGWFVTNDLVYTDEEGFVYMVGRADDIINVGGEKVSPIEVENVAQESPDIRECACIGVADPEGILGSVPVLYVVPENGRFDERKVSQFLSTKLEKYKQPHKYLIIDELPRNKLQKLDRKALHSLWEHRDEMTQPNEVILNILSRRSIREFTDQNISSNILKTIVQTGLYAPSGHNMQTWRFTVLQNREQIEALKDTVSEVAQDKGVHFYGFNNPAAVVLISNDRRNADGVQDSSCAAQNMMLAAHSLGIGSTWVNALMTICDEPRIRKMLQAFEIPDTHIVWSTLVMGYPSQEGRLLAKKQNVVRWL